MSPALIAILAALIGGLASYLFTYLSSIRDEFAIRTGAMLRVSEELAFAREKIKLAMDSQTPWPARYRLRSDAWDVHGAELASRLSEATWVKLQRTIWLLDAADIWACEIREAGQKAADAKGEFPATLKTLDGRLESDLQALDDSLAGARAKFTRGKAFGRLATGIIAIAAVAGLVAVASSTFSSAHSVSTGSLTRQLETQFPRSSGTICDKSTVLSDSYRCTVGFDTCAGQLEASVKTPPACSNSREDVLKVNANGRCFTARLVERLINGQPTTQPPGTFKRTLVRWGCING
jgi:hypothetical protein